MTKSIKKILLTAVILLGVAAMPNQEAFAQKKKKKAETSAAVTPAPEKKPEKKKLEDLVKGHKKFEGLFTFYQDTTSGEMKMLISKEQVMLRLSMAKAQIAEYLTSCKT
jgi:hypothetical protein